MVVKRILIVPNNQRIQTEIV